MRTQYRLIRQMADGRFHSGEALARRFGISRAAVWKHLKALPADLGLEVHAVPGKGYRLSRRLELLERDEILARLNGKARSRLQSLTIHDRIDSTNTWLLGQAGDGAPSGSVCLAELQTAGRGRRGRRWVSPFGSNIYLSLLWRYPLALPQLSGLSLAAGLATLRGLRQLGTKGIELKWPNDLIWKGRKLAGLLLEVRAESGGPSQVVVGIGINTRLSPQAVAEIDHPCVDLQVLLGGAGVSRNQLAALLIGQLLDAMDAFQDQGFAPLVAEWNRNDAYVGRPVLLGSSDRVIEGIHRGIDASGALLLECDGQVQAYHAGEVSLRIQP